MNLSGHAVETYYRDRYFYVLGVEKTYTLEEFFYKSNESETSITHEYLGKFKYCYKNKIYSYDELFNKDAINLEYPVFYSSPEVQRKRIFGILSRKEGYILRLSETLERYLAKARYETIKASNIFDLDFLNQDLNKHIYGFYYMQRCYNAENAIFSYYSAYEILMQLVWIYKDYYKKDEEFELILSECSLSKLLKRLTKENDNVFLSLLYKEKENNVDGKEYRVREEFLKIRDWCNSFKHHGILRFDGEKLSDEISIKRTFTQEYKNESGIDDFSNDDYAAIFLDLDNEVIPELINYHNEIIKVSKKIIELIS